ncbi:MAG TPA: hybrid sensor histidine kinase/response regulator [Deinococcales bacterium]|nr:hybrid sensor histidine kinase/response regulator [Deinococcales bacterium]
MNGLNDTPPAAPAPDGLPAVVLVVEDDESTRYLVTRTLQGAGYGTLEAGTGREGLRLAREIPDLIILDVRLPDADGYDLCRRLKSDPVTRDIPVLQVSAAFTGDEHRAEGLEAGADAYLVHPYGPKELVATVRTLIRVRRQADESRLLRETLEEQVRARTAALEAREQALAAFAAFVEESGEETSIRHLAYQAVEVIRAYLGEGMGLLWELEGDTWRAHVWNGDFPPETIAAVTRGIPESTPTHRQIMAEEHFVFLDGWTPDPEYGDLGRQYPATGGVRLLSDGRPPAILGFAFENLRQWQEREKAVVQAVSRALQLAVERTGTTARLASQAGELAARNRALDSFALLTERIGSERDPVAVAAHLHPVVDAVVGASGVAYWELRDGTWHGLAWWGELDEGIIGTLKEGIPEETPEHRRIVGAGGEPVFFDAWTPDGAYDGGADNFRAAAGMLVQPHGRPPGIVGIGLRDRTAFTAADRAVLGAAYRAVSLGIERASAGARLEQQKLELEARNAEQEAFLYTVSHDLRQPLLAIHGMGEILGEAVDSGDTLQARAMLRRVQANAQKMSALLDGLLSLSRIGRSGEAPERLDLGEALRAALSDLEGRIGARGVRVELDECWPVVLYPRSELGQVVTNLLTNAVKWAGRPGQEPRVAVACSEEGGMVVLRVSDNGPGMEPQYREKVFGLFQKLNAKAEGTGVGLAIVKRVAERHGGRAWIEDGPLGGATLAVSMPRG